MITLEPEILSALDRAQCLRDRNLYADSARLCVVDANVRLKDAITASDQAHDPRRIELEQALSLLRRAEAILTRFEL